MEECKDDYMFGFTMNIGRSLYLKPNSKYTAHSKQIYNPLQIYNQKKTRNLFVKLPSPSLANHPPLLSEIKSIHIFMPSTVSTVTIIRCLSYQLSQLLLSMPMLCCYQLNCFYLDFQAPIVTHPAMQKKKK